MKRKQNVIRPKSWRRRNLFRHAALAAAVVAFSAVAFATYERSQLPSLPTVTASTPGSPPYSRDASAVKTAASTRGPGGYRVIDGDTIEAPYGVKYRLLGYDTPETYFSKCDEELALGQKATRRLEELLASGEVRIVETGKTDKYRRALAHLHVNGRDVGTILIGEGAGAGI